MRRIGVLVIVMISALAIVGWQYGHMRQRHLNGPLWEAIRLSDPRATERALAAGADPNAYAGYWWPIHNYSYSALSGAVKQGDDEIVSVLLNAGANPNSTGRWNEPVLCEAVQGRKWNIARKLLKSGADPSITDQSRRSPLYFAAREGNVGAVRMLLEAGANVNAQDESGATSLQIAKEKGHREVSRLLVAAGAK
jgi:ankyrin repeat protein